MGRRSRRAEVAGADLADVIAKVREQLAEAQERRPDDGPAFEVKRVELEFSVQVARAGDGRGGLRIGVVSAEGGGSVSRDRGHRITVELAPDDEWLRVRRPEE